MSRLTIAIAARNASATIARAVRSCLPERGCEILLIDDRSEDDTVARALEAAGDRLRIVRTDPPGGIGRARQRGLESIATPFAAWLDADDEWEPGRADRLVAALDAGADGVSDAIELVDGPTGTCLRRLSAPSFLRRPHGALRLFERNFLPGDSQVAFRVATFRAADGYDPAVEGPESFDVLLRAVSSGARLAFDDRVGYRMYAYPTSLSRNLTRQRLALALALRKHDFESVRQRYLAAGFPPRVTAWALVTLALYRNEPATALDWLESAAPAGTDPAQVLETDGPWPFAEGWRRAFTRGTALLLLGRNDEACREFERAEVLNPSAEGINNLGVALARVGEVTAAGRCFQAALARCPGYQDARLNAAGTERITSHPLRRHAARFEYPGD